MTQETFEQMVERVANESEIQYLINNQDMEFGELMKFATSLRDELAKGQEPLGRIDDGRFAFSVEGGPNKWRERKSYTGPLYVHPFIATPPDARRKTEMTLDEAIQHSLQKSGNGETACRREHAQLASWLKELSELRKTVPADVAKDALSGLLRDMQTIAEGAFRIPVREFAMHALADFDAAMQGKEQK